MSRLVFVAVLALSSGCASSTVIRSHPSGAIVRNVRGEKVGKTPYSHSGSGIINSTDTFTVEKPGYEETSVTVRRDQVNGLMMAGLGIGGLVFFPLGLATWPGMLWAADYPATYEVELNPVRDADDEKDDALEESDAGRVSRRDDDDDNRETRRTSRPRNREEVERSGRRPTRTATARVD